MASMDLKDGDVSGDMLVAGEQTLEGQPTKLKLKRKQKEYSYKIVNDPVHGPIKIHPLCVKIIDTPEFQRLRYIKQLGCSYFVYPSAVHTRFEHGLGVYHLARKLINELQKQLGKSEISDEDALCVSIAGLCHDLGHGPYSHTWELFMKRTRPDKNWRHEEMSVKLFRNIWDNKLLEKDKKRFNLSKDHRDFIEDLISGSQKFKDPKRQFLYQIVANKRTGIDVDKWDYILRDSYYLGIKTSFDYHRLLQFSRVTLIDGERVICFKDSEILSLYQLFGTRWYLHRQAYKHRVSRIIERMLLDAFVEADKELLIKGSDGKNRKLSDSVDDPDTFLKINDTIYHRIKFELENSHPACKIIDRIESRELYKSVQDVMLSSELQIDSSAIEEKMRKGSQKPLPDFYIDIVKFDYGMNEEDPIKYVTFYGREDDKEARQVNKEFFPKMLPKQFQEVKLYCVLRERTPAEKDIETLRKAFQSYVDLHGENVCNGSKC